MAKGISIETQIFDGTCGEKLEIHYAYIKLSAIKIRTNAEDTGKAYSCRKSILYADKQKRFKS